MGAFLAVAFYLLISTSGPVTVSGTVSTEDGKPVTGALIAVHYSGRTDTAVSDAKGEFSVPGVTLPAVIDITAQGFAPFHREIPDGPGPIVVPAHLQPAALVESVL